MTKKIKIIELLNKIANGEEVPEKIKIRGNTLKWIEIDFEVEEEKGYKVIDKNSNFYWLQDIISLDSIEDLNEEVEILEDNTEQIEGIELIGTNFMDMDKNQLKDEINKNRIFINKLRQEIFELRKDKNND